MRRSIPVILITLLLVPAAARGEEPRPASRGLKLIDFEERKLGNNEDLPMHWIKISGAGLPHYVNGYLASDRAHSGQYSFRFDLNGGSLVYRYDPTQIPIMAGAKYHVECFCQTTVMPAARARLTAYFTDLDGHPLADDVGESELYAAKNANEGWKKLSVDLTADNPKAAYLAVELGLLQPEFYASRSLGERTLLPEDIHGSAWFDDVAVAQVPQVTMSTGKPGNVFRHGEPATLSLLVNDLFIDDLQSRLVVRDATGALVYQHSGAVDMAGATNLGPTRRRLSVGLPALPPGWYEAELVVSSRGHDLGTQIQDFIQLADSAETVPPDPRFGVNATDLTAAELSELPKILPLLSAGRVKIAVWSEQSELGSQDSLAFDTLLQNLAAEGITPTGCLNALPPDLAKELGGASWLRLLQADPQKWQPQVAYLVSRHANYLDHWQLGADSSDAFVSDSRMRDVYDLIYKEFLDLTPKPDLAMPWPAYYDLGPKLPATVALSIPAQVLPQRIGLYLNDLLNPATAKEHQFSVSLALANEQYGRDVILRDLAQRLIYCLSAGANRIDLPLPFKVQMQDGQVIEQPREEFMVERTVMRLMSGAKFTGKINLDPGVAALLFNRGGQGILAIWSKGARETQTINVSLGANVLKVDLWGAVTPLTQVGNGPDMKVQVGPMPFFLVGLDGISSQIRATIAFDQPLVESSFQSHTRHLTFANPTGSALTGRVRLHPPAGWTMTPSSIQFSVNPGQTFSQEVTIDFPYNSVAGPKTTTADFSIEGENQDDFTVPLALTLGLSDVGMQSSALRDGTDLLVQEVVTNYSERPIDYTAYAAYPGLTRQERIVQSLDPGRTTIKLYRFKNVKFIPNATVRCGLRELEGTRVLNDEVKIQ